MNLSKADPLAQMPAPLTKLVPRWVSQATRMPERAVNRRISPKFHQPRGGLVSAAGRQAFAAEAAISMIGDESAHVPVRLQGRQ
jgi:hypothetical protein